MKYWQITKRFFLVAIAGVIAWEILAFFLPAPWNSFGPVAVGGGYSVQLETRCSSSLGYAEYDRRLRVFVENPGRGKQTGLIELFPNTGGRTHELIFSSKQDEGERRIVIEGRTTIEELDIANFSVVARRTGDWRAGPKWVFLGTYSGESLPLKFIPQGTLSEDDSRKIFRR